MSSAKTLSNEVADALLVAAQQPRQRRLSPLQRQYLADMPTGAVLDGEVCVLDEMGRSDFNRLRARARRKGWYEGADPGRLLRVRRPDR